MNTETNKLIVWFNDQIQNHGLVDFKIFVNEENRPTSVEELSRDINAMLEAETIPDPMLY